MRKRFDKLVAAFLAVMLCVAFVPLAAIAASPDGDGNPDITVTETEGEEGTGTGEENPDPNAGIALTNLEEEGDPVDDGEPVTPDPVVEPEVPEVVEPVEGNEEPTGEEGVEPGISPVALFNDEIEVQAEEGVASVNGTPYDSLQDAVNAATSGATILLNQDAYECITVSSTKSFVLDLQGHTIDAQNKGVAFSVDAPRCDVSLKNGNIENGKRSSSPYGAGFVATQSNIAISLEGISFLNNDKTGAYAITVGGTNVNDFGSVTIKDCKITGSAGGVYLFTNQTVTLDNVEIYGNLPTSNHKEAIYIKGKRGVTHTLNNVNVHDNNTTNKMTVKLVTSVFEVTNSRICNNTAGLVGGIFKDAGASLTLTNTVIANNVCTAKVTANPSTTNPYTGGLACVLGTSEKTADSVSVNSGAIYGNTRGGVASDVFMVASQNRYGFAYSDVDILSASSMSDSQFGGNVYFKNHGFQWQVDDSSKATYYGLTEDSVAKAMQADGRIAFNTKVYPKVPSTQSPWVTFIAAATTEPKSVASVNDTLYSTLSDAFAAAQDGDIVQLYFEEGADKSAPITVEEQDPIIVDKNVIFDTNGGFIGDAVVFNIEDGASFKIINASGTELSNNREIVVNNCGAFALSSNVDIQQIVNEGKSNVLLSGNHGTIKLDNGCESNIELTSDFTAERIELSLASYFDSLIQNQSLSHDIDVLQCANTEQAKALVESDSLSIEVIRRANVKPVATSKSTIALRMISEDALIYFDPVGRCDHKDAVEAGNALVFNSIEEAFKAAKGEREIIVCSSSAITINEKKYFDLPEGSVQVYSRCSANTDGELFYTKTTVEIGNVVLDGKGIPSKSAMLTMDRGSVVTLKSGTVMKNAYRDISFSGGKWEAGGAAIEMKYGSGSNDLRITGASFIDNYCGADGGAIWCWNSHIAIESGTFSRNEAGRWGGFLNSTWDSTLEITGGTFEENIARREGGALALWGLRDESGGHGTKTTITGGDFIGNCSNMVWTDPGQYYAGGAIYNDRNCTLEMKNVIATENQKMMRDKNYSGCAAIANCPTSKFAVYKQDGALIYNNGDGQGDVSYNPNDSKAIATVSPYALGGGECRWQGVETVPRLSNKTFNVDKSYYTNTKNFFNIVSNPSEGTLSLAYGADVPKVTFMYNKSNLQGSAVMNNGTLIIGSKMKSLTVTKEWQDENGKTLLESNHPGQVKVQLAVDGRPVDPSIRTDAEVVLNKENAWSYTWTDLGDGINWNVIEVDENGYELSIKNDGDIDNGVVKIMNWTLTNTWKDERTNISAQKWWEDQDNLFKIQPTSIELTLVVDNNNNGIADDDEMTANNVQKATVYDTDDWRYEFTDLPKYTKKGEEIKYLVAETPVDGYVSNVEPAQKTDENGEPVFDEEGNPVLAWTDDDNMWWSAFNITNSLEFADIELTKTFNGQIYQDGDGNNNSTAVFRITGEFEGTDYKYDNVISVIFDSSDTSDTQSVPVNGLLVGGIYTIEELSFNGSGYEGSGEVYKFKMIKEGPVAIDGDSDEIITIVFTNTGDDEENPNQGVINRYKFESGNKSWEQIGPKQDQAA